MTGANEKYITKRYHKRAHSVYNLNVIRTCLARGMIIENVGFPKDIQVLMMVTEIVMLTSTLDHNIFTYLGHVFSATFILSDFNPYLLSHCPFGRTNIKWNHFEMRLLNLRINFFFIADLFPHLGSFCVVSSFTTFRPNFISGLLRVIYRDLG